MADFKWCPAPNVALKRMPRITEVAYGDGYKHRITTGINIYEDAVSAAFTGKQTYIGEIDTFLQLNFLQGFTWSWLSPTVLWTCDTWQITWQDKGDSLNGLLGSLQAEFKRANNHQPLSLVQLQQLTLTRERAVMPLPK